MRSYDVAFLRIDGKELVLVPVRPAFGMRSAREMQAFVATIRSQAAAAGLSGDVIPVWDDGAGGLMAFARPSLLPRLARLTWDRVRRHVNVRLHVGPGGVELRAGHRTESQVEEALAS